MMDKSYDTSKSDGSSEEEWMDLSKSDYAKVIFSKLYWNSGSGDVGCCFTLTETVNKNSSDYIGIYKVGHDSLSQCLAMKKLSEFKFDDESKPIHCDFKSEELPDLNGFYQFLYVTHENEVCGASTPFEVRHSQEEVEEVVTERVENDFLMVRYGLEQRNYKLETLLKTYETENVVLVSKTKELGDEKAHIIEKLEKAQQEIISKNDELKLLKEQQVDLIKELKLTEIKTADAVMTRDSAIEGNVTISAELHRSEEDVAKLMQEVKELETKYQNAVVCHETRSAELEIELEEKRNLVADSNRIISELKEEIKGKQTDIEKIKSEHLNLIKAKDLTIEEYKERVNQLCMQMEKLTSELISKEKLLKIQRSGDREQMEQDYILDVATKRKIIGKEIEKLAGYLEHFQECTEKSFNGMQTTEDERLLVEQLEDAKVMIKALEDSKHLAMKELYELSEKLKKTKKELSQWKCETAALKIFLEENTNFGSSYEDRNSSEEQVQAQTDNVEIDLLSKLKEIDPTVDMENLEKKLMDFIDNSQQQSKIIRKLKLELNKLRCEKLAFQVLLEEKTSCSTSKEDAVNENLKKDRKVKFSDKEIQVDNTNLIMLREECKSKEVEIETLNEKLKFHQKTTLDALMNAEDKTARIVQAAELYKDLYKEKEKLAKHLRKLTRKKSRSKKSSSLKEQDNSKPIADSLALNIEKALTSSETTSNNSDSDTGEHVCSQILYPDLQEDENYVPEPCLPPSPVEVETEVKPCYYECNSLDVATSDPCTIVKDDEINNAASKMNSLSLQPLSVEEDTHIPCLICGKSFLITPQSNIPMMEHIEKEHNMNICPLCGQMFDKNFPSKYLMFHINDHFKSE